MSQAGEAKEKDIIDTFKHIHVPEVVREKRMHFQRVPRLGAFMAVPLVYDHCLTDTALDEAVNNYQEFAKQKEEQDKERKVWEEERANRVADAAAAGEHIDEEVRDFPEIEYAPF